MNGTIHVAPSQAEVLGRFSNIDFSSTACEVRFPIQAINVKITHEEAKPVVPVVRFSDPALEIRLGLSDFERISQALENPPAPNDTLRGLFLRYGS